MPPRPSGSGGLAGDFGKHGEAASAASRGGAEIDDLRRTEAVDEARGAGASLGLRGGGTGGAKIEDLGGTEAVDEARGAGASLAFGGARTGAQAAMHTAAAVGH